MGKSLPRFALRPTAAWCSGIILVSATLAFLRQRLRWGEFAPLDTMLVLPVAGCLLVVAVVYSRVKGRDPRNIGIAALVTFGIGLAAGGLDRVGECLCAPGAPIQGHSVWHLCAAAAALLFCRWNAWDDLMEGRASALPRYRPASQR